MAIYILGGNHSIKDGRTSGKGRGWNIQMHGAIGCLLPALATRESFACRSLIGKAHRISDLTLCF